MAEEQRTAGGVEYTLTRRRVKNINLRVRPDGTVAASASRWVSARQVDEFVASRAQWVENARRRALAKARALCARYWPEFAAQCPMGYPAVKVRDMKSRWGSCNLKTNTLTFSLRLFAMPEAAQEYVVVHEFSHFQQANHSAAFWAVVSAHMPDWKRRRALLRQQ